MSWIFLISAGLLEIAWAYFMKKSMLGEAVTPMRWVAAGLIVAGIVLMKLSS